MSSNSYNIADIFSTPVPKVESPVSSDVGWYVLRYRVLTQKLKAELKNVPYEIFHRYKLQNAKAGNSTSRAEVPVLHGFVFVHATFSQCKELASRLGLSMMYDPFYEFVPQDTTIKKVAINQDTCSAEPSNTEKDESAEAKRYVCIRHKEMLPFMRAVELNAYNLKFYDPKVIDLQKDDLVEFIEGDLKGTRGYLKPGKGRNGGLVIVPLVLKRSSNDVDDTPHPHLANFCYSLEASQDELGIVAFAKGNRHAKDCIIDAKPIVDAAFACYSSTGKIDSSTQERLIAFVRRYGSARVNTSIQAAQHLSMLYRINTILQHHIIGAELRHKIAEVVIPELLRRKKDALKRVNFRAAKKHQELLEEIVATDKLFEAQSGTKIEKID